MKKKIFVSLKFKITFSVSIILALLASFIYFYFPLKFEEENFSIFKKNANLITKIVSYNVSSELNFDGTGFSEEEIEKFFSDELNSYVIIMKNDSIYFKYNDSLAMRSSYANLNIESISAETQIFKTQAPIIIKDEIIGDLYMGFSIKPIIIKVSEFKTYIGKVSLALFFIGTILVFLIGTIFINPLKKIVNTLNERKDESFNQIDKVKTNDEIGFLVSSFNIMVKKITETKVEMDQIKKDLEKRVRDRTRDLEGALKSLQNENKQRRTAEIEISNSLHEKEVLLKEIHHRVKNNLQIVSSLLFFQSKQIEDPKTLDMFRDGQNRVKSMALIHEKLYQSGDLANIDFKQYVKKLVNFLFQSYGVNQTKIKLKNNVQEVQLGVDSAVPFGLIINEIISNSLKHGFKNQESGEIKIDMGYDESNKLILIISDNGVGISEDLNIEESESLGLRLVNNLTTQLNGTVTFLNNNGTIVKIVIQNPNPKRVS